MAQTRQRRVWALADAHIGREIDGRDGDAWLAMAIDDVRRRFPPVDYALFLGDMTARYEAEEFRKYVRLRDGSGIRWWYEIAGNHDFHGTETGDYQRIIRAPLRYTMVDGNTAFIFFSAERGRAAGLLGEETAAWLADRLARHQGRNVVVCAHQAVHNTVARSDDFERYLHPHEVVADLLSRYRVDLWLSGHTHSRPRLVADAAVMDGTTHINVASVSHVYNTEASNSFLLEMTPGSRVMRARCREHDAGRWRREFEVKARFPFPFDFGPLPDRAMPRRR